jgi:hypothetical protein
MTERARQRRFLRGELRHHWLADVETVVDELSALVSGRHRAGQQAGERGERVASHAGWKEILESAIVKALGIARTFRTNQGRARSPSGGRNGP